MKTKSFAPPKFTIHDIIDVLKLEEIPIPLSEISTKARLYIGMSRSTFFRLWGEAKAYSFIVRTDGKYLLDPNCELPQRPENHSQEFKDAKTKAEVVASKMPPLSHYPDQEQDFDIRKSQVVQWLIQQPEVLQSLFNYYKVRSVKFNPITQKWSGINS
jgi:hypothetical protein